MDNEAVVRLAHTLAIQAEIEGMKACNIQRRTVGESLVYSEQEFMAKAEELRNVASVHIDQLLGL